MSLRRESAHLTSDATSVRMCWTWDTKGGSAVFAQSMGRRQADETLTVVQGTGWPGIPAFLNHGLPASLVTVLSLTALPRLDITYHCSPTCHSFSKKISPSSPFSHFSV